MKYFIVILILFFTPHTLFGCSGDSSIFLFLKGYRSETQGKLDDAIECYKSAIKNDPSSSALRIELAVAYLKKGNLDEAEKVLKETIGLNKNNTDALKLLAGVYSARNMPEKAKALYEKMHRNKRR